MMETEPDWTRALRASDSGTQAAALSALRGILLRGLHVALRGRADISSAHLEDFAQEGLLRVMSRLDQFQGRSRFTTWALTIALNTAFAELRRKHWQDVSLEGFLSAGARLSEPSILPENALGDSEERIRIINTLRQAIAEHLTKKQKAAVLAELGGLPFDQIAALLGTTRNAAYKLLHDARRALKHHLHDAGITAQEIRLAFNS